MSTVCFVCPSCGKNYTLEQVRRKEGWFVCGKCDTKLTAYDPDENEMSTLEIRLVDDEENIVNSALFISTLEKIITEDTFDEVVNKIIKSMGLVRIN